MNEQTRNPLLEKFLEEFVDFLLPLLNPYEASLYLYLVRRSHLAVGSPDIRVGKRTIAKDFGQGGWLSKPTSYRQITKVLNALGKKGCISIGDTTTVGTLYRVKLPREVPVVMEHLAALNVSAQPLDYFRDPNLRKQLFERDNRTCRYCGEQVSDDNATLDHHVPQSKGGPDSPENLWTCCRDCNAIKAGKSYEEAAPALLTSLLGRKRRRQSQ